LNFGCFRAFDSATLDKLKFKYKLKLFASTKYKKKEENKETTLQRNQRD